MKTRLVMALGLLAATAAGCPPPVLPPLPPSRTLIVVPRSAVPNIYTHAGATGYTLPTSYVGDVIAVVGHDFDPVWIENRVTVQTGAEVWTCPILGYRKINADAPLGELGALFFEIPNVIRPGSWLRLSVTTEGQSRNDSTSLSIHRRAYARPSTGNTLVAIDVSMSPPGWVSGYDFNVPATPDTLTITPDGRFACCTAGRDFYIVILADGQLLVRRNGLLRGPAGPAAMSPDGSTLCLGVFPGAPTSPELALVDVSGLITLTLQVAGNTGLLSAAGGAPAIPTPATITLGGSSPGGATFTSDGSSLYVTLSNGAVREWSISAPATPSFVQDITLGSGAAPLGIVLSPGDKRAFVTDIANNTVIPIDLNPVTVRIALGTGATPIAPAFSPDGTRLVIANAGAQTASVFDLVPGSIVGHSPPTLGLGFAPGPTAVAPERPIGQTGGCQILVLDGNRVRFIAVDGTSGAVGLMTFQSGPFAQTLTGVAVTPQR